MIAMSGCEAIDEGLNEMKAVLMSVTRNLLSFTFEKRPKIKVEGNYFFSMVTPLLPLTLQSLHFFCG